MAKDKKEENKIFNFQIKSIELIKQNFALPVKQIEAITNFNFNIGLEQKLDHVNKLIIVITHIDIFKTEDLDLKLGSASVACVFTIEKYEEVVQIDKKGITHIEEYITQTLNSISISTTRGVLSQLFRGTFLHNAILPIVNPKSFKTAPIPKDK